MADDTYTLGSYARTMLKLVREYFEIPDNIANDDPLLRKLAVLVAGSANVRNAADSKTSRLTTSSNTIAELLGTLGEARSTVPMQKVLGDQFAPHKDTAKKLASSRETLEKDVKKYTTQLHEHLKNTFKALKESDGDQTVLQQVITDLASYDAQRKELKKRCDNLGMDEGRVQQELDRLEKETQKMARIAQAAITSSDTGPEPE